MDILFHRLWRGGTLMHTLREYLSNATHYLSPNPSPGGVEAQREQFIRYCEAYGLDRKFDELVERCPSWKQLAESVPVCFFEDVYHLSKFSGPQLPSIHIFCGDLATVPVIKLLIKNKADYDLYKCDH